MTGMALSELENTQKTECEENHKEHDFQRKTSLQQLQEIMSFFLLQVPLCREVGTAGVLSLTLSPMSVPMGSPATESVQPESSQALRLDTSWF